MMKNILRNRKLSVLFLTFITAILLSGLMIFHSLSPAESTPHPNTPAAGSAAGGLTADTAEPTKTPTPTPKISEVKMSVTGDLMVHEEQLNFAYNKETKSYDFDYPFEPVTDYLSDADITLGNLETTLAGEAYGYRGYPQFSSPDAFAEALKRAGFDFLTTANNHSNDSWEGGLLRTIQVLDDLGLRHTGTFAGEDDRNAISILEINGISFAILSYTYGTNGLPLTEGKPWLANIMDEALIRADIQRAKDSEPDFIIVLPHMGNEYETTPRQVFKDWAEMMLKAGADIVLASHPHVLQPVEFYQVEDEDGSVRDCFVAYSLGNFISSQRTVPRESGIILNLHFKKTEGAEATLNYVSYIPTWVKFSNAAGSRDIKVLSVFDALKACGEPGADFQPSAADRLKQIHTDTTKMFLGQSLPVEEIENEYIIPKENTTLIAR